MPAEKRLKHQGGTTVIMSDIDVQPETSVAHAQIAADGTVLAATPGFLSDGLAGIECYLSAFALLDGEIADAETVRKAADRLRHCGGVVAAEEKTGTRWTICTHAIANDGLSIAAARTATPRRMADGDAIRARSLLYDMLRSLNEGCALFDEDNRLIVCNDHYRDMNGSVREFIAPGVHFETLLREMVRRRAVRHANGREATWIEQILRAAESEESFEIERSDGAMTVVNVRPIAAGGFILTEVDITARRRAERSAKASEQLLSTVLNASPANLCMSQIGDGSIIYKSPSCTGLFGNCLNAHGQFANPLDRADFLTEILATGEIDDFAAEARREDGTTFPALFSARVIDYRGEEVLVSSVTDLTDRIATDRQLKEASIRLRDAIEALSEGFILYDQHERVVTANQRFLEMNAPYAHKIKPGTHTRDLLEAAVETGHLVDAERWMQEYEEELDRGEGGCHRTFEFQFSDGTWVNSVRRPTREGGYVITWLDVTDQKHAVTALAVANDRMRDAIDSIDEGFALFDADERLVMWNKKYVQLSSHIADSIRTGVTFSEIMEAAIDVGPYDEETSKRMRAQIALSDWRQPMREEFSHAEGRWHSVSRCPTTEGGFVVTRIDITEQKQAADQLARLNDRIRDAIESLDAGFALYDAEDRLVTWNSRYTDLNRPIAHVIREGTTYKEILETAVEVHKLSDDEAEIVRASGSRKDGNNRLQFEFENKDGRWFSVTRNPTSENGFVITRTDITERKDAEAAEREAYALPARVLNACPVALVMSDLRTAENTYRNAEDLALFGETRAAADFWAKPEERSAFLAAITVSGRVDEMEATMVRADGTKFPALVSARTIDFQGERYVVTYNFDLSDRVQMEKELSRQQEMLYQSEKLSALGELLAGVAHELNNPLSVVVGHALMMEEEIDDPDLLKRTRKISSAAERCSRIVKTFLSMARQRPTKLEQISINSVIETALEVAGYGIRSAGMRVDSQLAPDLPPVNGDADQLAQVLANLIVNAEQAMKGMGPEGRLTISTRLSRSGKDVVIDVIDNGPGIPKKIRARIFEPFFTTKTVGDGTGIGLAFCHRVVESHHGQISVDEAEDGGAQFTIRLAAVAPISDETVQDDTVQTIRGAALVIDDEKDVAELITQVLEKDDYRVTTVHSAEAALNLMPGAFDIILSDINMPGLSGRDFLAAVREEWPELADRIGFVTGDTMSPDAEQFLRMSGKPYLEKPVVPSDLRRLASAILSKD